MRKAAQFRLQPREGPPVDLRSLKDARVSNGLSHRHKSPKKNEPTGTYTHNATKTIRGAIFTSVSSSTMKLDRTAKKTRANPSSRPTSRPKRPAKEFRCSKTLPFEAFGNLASRHPETKAAKEIIKAAAATKPNVVTDIGNSPGGPTP